MLLLGYEGRKKMTKESLQSITEDMVDECKRYMESEKQAKTEKGELIFFQRFLDLDKGNRRDDNIIKLKKDTYLNYAGNITKQYANYPSEIVLEINFKESIFIDRLISKGIMRDKRDTTIIINQTNLEQLKEVVNSLLQEGHNLMFHTDFSNYTASYQQQVNDLDEFITALNPEQNKAVLIGHSQGGIVSIGYVASELCNDKVSKIITFGTPYNLSDLKKLASRLKTYRMLNLREWANALETIKTSWNSKKLHERVSAHAVGCVLNPGLVAPKSDGIVSLESQHAKGFYGITTHTMQFFTDTFESRFHTYESDNTRVISKLEKLVLGTPRDVSNTPFLKEDQRCGIESLHLIEVGRTIDNADLGRRESIGGLQERCEDNRKSKEDLDRMLLYAVNKGLFNSTKVIVDKLKEFDKADVINTQETYMGLRPLQMAVLNGRTDIAMYLIEQLEPRYLHSKNIDGVNVFQIAAYIGNIEVLRELIAKNGQNAIKAINKKNSPNDQDVLAFNSFDVAFSMYIAIKTAEKLYAEKPDTAKKILETKFNIIIDDTTDVSSKISELKQRYENVLELLRENGGELSYGFSFDREYESSRIALSTIEYLSFLAKSFYKKGPCGESYPDDKRVPSFQDWYLHIKGEDVDKSIDENIKKSIRLLDSIKSGDFYLFEDVFQEMNIEKFDFIENDSKASFLQAVAYQFKSIVEDEKRETEGGLGEHEMEIRNKKIENLINIFDKLTEDEDRLYRGDISLFSLICRHGLIFAIPNVLKELRYRWLNKTDKINLGQVDVHGQKLTDLMAELIKDTHSERLKKYLVQKGNRFMQIGVDVDSKISDSFNINLSNISEPVVRQQGMDVQLQRRCQRDTVVEVRREQPIIFQQPRVQSGQQRDIGMS